MMVPMFSSWKCPKPTSFQCGVGTCNSGQEPGQRMCGRFTDDLMISATSREKLVSMVGTLAPKNFLIGFQF